MKPAMTEEAKQRKMDDAKEYLSNAHSKSELIDLIAEAIVMGKPFTDLIEWIESERQNFHDEYNY